ncbi:uncharacterized protein [Lolium perenne]|uniref:uncharacterized protein n=1 Tax=Lolium perenne TaxID=4522 RepID=UPI0021F6788F|nr:uncharacterized protein LOC127318300 [Lolium perenne]
MGTQWAGRKRESKFKGKKFDNAFGPADDQEVVFAESLPVLRSVTDGSIHAWFDLERVGAAALAYEANKLLVIENVQVAPRQDGEEFNFYDATRERHVRLPGIYVANTARPPCICMTMDISIITSNYNVFSQYYEILFKICW